jgi:hypothetical protein
LEKAKERGMSSLSDLEAWLQRLEMKYIKLAAEIAAYEKGRECGSVHEDYDEMDRIEKDIVRARKAIDLYHRYFGEHVDRAVVCK